MKGQVVDPDRLLAFVVDILGRVGIPERHATSVAEHMVWSDMHGRPNYGVWRLPILCRRAKSGLFERERDPSIQHVSPSSAIVTGHNVIGHHVATYATDAAVEIARRSGVSAVFVRESNFIGALGYYAVRMTEVGMIGLVMSNSHPRVAAHGGAAPVLGTNPLAFAAPRPGGAPVIVDMATAAAAGSLITKSIESGVPLPVGVAVKRDGTPLTDAAEIGDGAMLPMAGAKGFGLALMVEILAGVVSGAGVSHGVHSMYQDFENPGDSGHAIFAIDLAPLNEEQSYSERINGLSGSLVESGEVRIPGDAREAARVESIRRGGVALDAATLDALEGLASALGAEPPWPTRVAATGRQ